MAAAKRPEDIDGGSDHSQDCRAVNFVHEHGTLQTPRPCGPLGRAAMERGALHRPGISLLAEGCPCLASFHEVLQEPALPIDFSLHLLEKAGAHQ